MISVCMASHNGGKYVKEQLLSILQQLADQDEVIVSDDGSSDNTVSVIFELNDPRIKIIAFKQPSKSKHPHTYVSKNFENAIKHAKGDFLFLADQDDYWYPNKVSVCLKYLKNNLLVVHRADICDGNLNPTGELMYKDNFVFNNFLALKKGKYYGCTIAFRKELLNVVLPFPNRLLLHDHWIGCLAELSGKVYYYDKSLMKYRMHDTNTSSKSSNSLLFQIWYRIDMFVLMIVRFLFKGRNIVL